MGQLLAFVRIRKKATFLGGWMKENVFLPLGECQPEPDLTVWGFGLIHSLRQAYLGSAQTALLFMAVWPV